MAPPSGTRVDVRAGHLDVAVLDLVAVDHVDELHRVGILVAELHVHVVLADPLALEGRGVAHRDVDLLDLHLHRAGVDAGGHELLVVGLDDDFLADGDAGGADFGRGRRVGDHRVAHQDRAGAQGVPVVGDLAEGDAEGVDPPLGVVEALARTRPACARRRSAHCGSTSSARRCRRACPGPTGTTYWSQHSFSGASSLSTPPSTICSRHGAGRRGWRRGRSGCSASAARARS